MQVCNTQSLSLCLHFLTSVFLTNEVICLCEQICFQIRDVNKTWPETKTRPRLLVFGPEEIEAFQNFLETKTFKSNTETFFEVLQTRAQYLFQGYNEDASSPSYSFSNSNVLIHNIGILEEGRYSKAFQLSLSSSLTFLLHLVCQI